MVGDGGHTVLLLEIAYHAGDRCILDIATTLSLPGYTALLQQLLIGRPIDDALQAAAALVDHYHGPLSKATLSAIANAIANSHDGSGRSARAPLPPDVRDGTRP